MNLKIYNRNAENIILGHYKNIDPIQNSFFDVKFSNLKLPLFLGYYLNIHRYNYSN